MNWPAIKETILGIIMIIGVAIMVIAPWYLF
jgi:hypothetical protein